MTSILEEAAVWHGVHETTGWLQGNNCWRRFQLLSHCHASRPHVILVSWAWLTQGYFEPHGSDSALWFTLDSCWILWKFGSKECRIGLHSMIKHFLIHLNSRYLAASWLSLILALELSLKQDGNRNLLYKPTHKWLHLNLCPVIRTNREIQCEYYHECVSCEPIKFKIRGWQLCGSNASTVSWYSAEQSLNFILLWSWHTQL